MNEKICVSQYCDGQMNELILLG